MISRRRRPVTLWVSRSSSRRKARRASRALRASRPTRARGRSASRDRAGLKAGTNEACITPALRSTAGRPISARRPRNTRRARGGQAPSRSSRRGRSMKSTAEGTMRGASSGSSASRRRQMSGSSTSWGRPDASSQRAKPELVVPKSSAQPLICVSGRDDSTRPARPRSRSGGHSGRQGNAGSGGRGAGAPRLKQRRADRVRSPRYARRTYSYSKGRPLMPRAGLASQLAILPGSRTGCIRLRT